MAVPAILGITAFITVILAVTLYAGEKGLIHWSPGVIIIMAAAVRLLFLFRPPELSDDIYRYLWDGLQIVSGHNPYSEPPSSFPLQYGMFRELLGHINHADLVTIYPPAAQMIFAIGASIGKGVIGIKLLLLLLDLITCVMIIRLLSFAKLPQWGAILYAWHPLPVIEISASGHIDGAGIFFFFIALMLTMKQSGDCSSKETFAKFSQSFRKSTLPALFAGFAFGFAVLVKIFPVIFLPAIFILVGKRNLMPFLSGILIVIITLIFPFLPDLKNMLMTLNIYLQNWEFSGILFRTLRRIISSGNITRLILASAFILSLIYFYAMLWFKKERSPLKTLYHITLAFLFLTPTLHPWYVLYLVCLLPFVQKPAGLVLTWSILLSYRVIIPYCLLGQWVEDDYTPALIWAAPAAVYLLTSMADRYQKLPRER